MNTKRPRTIAFYLPQFHPIDENDRWWGKGFTEWTNVRRAKPLFDGHDHPRKVASLGEYDLRDAEIMRAQAALAGQNGIDAFCMYFYWFNGVRLLEKPLDNYLASGPDFPFLLSWANENWSRRWDGKDKEVLIGQEYSFDTAEKVFESLYPYLADPRYLRVNGAVAVLVHRVDHLHDAHELATTWRRLARARGLGELHLIAAETKPGIRASDFGFDAVCEFPPVGSNTLRSALLRPPPMLSRKFRGRLMSYTRMARRFLARKSPDFIRYRGVAPGWDNTARRGNNATVYVGSTPAMYAQWLARARQLESLDRGSDGLVFVNAWNEWAEGAYLEPDATNGFEYLAATRDSELPFPRGTTRPIGRPTYGWLHSLALVTAGSILASLRRFPRRGGSR